MVYDAVYMVGKVIYRPNICRAVEVLKSLVW